MRERDALVAEKVMGWRRYRFDATSKRGGDNRYWLDDPTYRTRIDGPGVVLAYGDETPYADAFNDIPRFSTDPAAAVTVIDRLRRRGVVVLVRGFQDGYVVEAWKDSPQSKVQVPADSFCEGVVAAALAYAGAEVARG